MTQIIMLAAGLGSRFTAAGYRQAKPMIPVHGVPMYEHVLSKYGLQTEDVNFIFSGEAVRHLPRGTSGLRFLSTCQTLRGPAHSALHALVKMPTIDLAAPVLFLDCDSFATIDLLAYLRPAAESKATAAMLTFLNEEPARHFSAVHTDGYFVTHIHERTVTAPTPTYSGCGVYWFSSGYAAAEAASHLLRKSIAKEIYMSDLLNHLIVTNNLVLNVPVPRDSFHCLGTPEELEAYLKTDHV